MDSIAYQFGINLRLPFELFLGLTNLLFQKAYMPLRLFLMVLFQKAQDLLEIVLICRHHHRARQLLLVGLHLFQLLVQKLVHLMVNNPLLKLFLKLEECLCLVLQQFVYPLDVLDLLLLLLENFAVANCPSL